MSTLSREAWKVVHRKLKYAEKTLSDQAILDVMATVSYNFDLYRILFYNTFTTSLFSSLVLQLLLGIPLAEMGNFFDFKIELPTPEEHVKGLLLRVDVLRAVELYPETVTVDGLLAGVLSDVAYGNYVENKISKGVFGLSKYGYAYYDPPAVYEFLRSTLLRIALEDVYYYTALASVRAFTRALNISEPVSRDIYDRIQIMKHLTNYCVLGSGRLGSCMLPVEDERGAWITYRDMDGNVSTVNSETIVDVAGSCILGKSILGQCYVFDGERSLTKGDNLLFNIRDEMVMRANSRLITTPLIVANYQRADELVNPGRSIRTEHFGLSILRNTSIRMIVDSVLGDRVVDPHARFAYYVAVMDLYGKTTRPRGWGHEAYRALPRDELLSVWKNKWVAQGLDGSILDELFDILYDTGVINSLREKRLYERKVVRLSRGGSP